MEKQKDIFEYLKLNKGDTPSATYFDNLAEEIIEMNRRKVIPLYKKPVFWLSSAAAIITVVFLINFNNSNTEIHPLLALNDIPTSEVLEYVESNIDEYDLELIVEYISDDAMESEPIINEGQVPEELNQQLTESISMSDIDGQDILDYFEEEGIEMYEIEDESFI